MKNKVKIYVRKNTWDAYIVSDDGYGAPITISVNKNNMDENIYATGWEAYRDKQIDSGATVETYVI